jgi:tetratricopeptide (TPR) repeat protein
MAIKLLYLFILINLLVACSSSNKKSVHDEKKDEFYWIENSDFVPPKLQSYRRDMDYFSGSNGQIDVLSKESLARASTPRLESVARKDQPIGQANSLCHQNQFDQAKTILRKNFLKYHKHPSYWNQVGVCYFLKGEQRKALLFFNKARELDSKYSPAINNLAVLYLQRGEDAKALEALLSVSKMDRKAKTPKFNLAQLYLRYGFFDQAFPLLTSLNRSGEKDVDVINGLATYHLSKGNPARALELFAAIPAIYSSKPYIALNYVLALILSNKKEEARELIRRVDSKSLETLSRQYKKLQELLGDQA